MSQNQQKAIRSLKPSPTSQHAHRIQLLELKVQQLQQSLRHSQERLRDEKKFNAGLKKVYEQKIREIEVHSTSGYVEMIKGLKEENEKLKREKDLLVEQNTKLKKTTPENSSLSSPRRSSIEKAQHKIANTDRLLNKYKAILSQSGKKLTPRKCMLDVQNNSHSKLSSRKSSLVQSSGLTPFTIQSDEHGLTLRFR